jgi:hypothetical protein
MESSIKCPHCNGEVTLVPAPSPNPLRVREDPNISVLRQILEKQQKEYLERQKQFLPQLTIPC